MNSVGNDFRRYGFVSKYCSQHARLAMRERTHGIEHMHRVPRAMLNAHASLGVSGIGVTERDRDSRLLGRFDDLLCSRQLRRQRQNTRAAICRRHEAIEYRDRRLRQYRRRMHSSPGRADEWPFQMNAVDLRANRLRDFAVSIAFDITRDAFQALAGFI